MSHSVTGMREHLAAKREIEAAGGDHRDADTYEQALESVVQASATDDYLEKAGAFPEASSDTVTREMLIERANIILVESGHGFTEVLPSGLIDGVPRNEIERAFRQAVEELGQIGDRRRDADELMRARHERIVEDAVRARKIPRAQKPVWVAQLDSFPAEIAAALAKLPVDPYLDSLADVHGDRVTLYDDEGLELAIAADDLVVRRGQATRDPRTNGIVGCSADDYAQALIDLEAKAARAADAGSAAPDPHDQFKAGITRLDAVTARIDALQAGRS